MISVVFYIALAIGCALAFIALIFLRKVPDGDFFKAMSDMFMKLAVVIFGVSIGLLAFFGQRWIEDTNEKIQQANEALGNVDIVQSEYMSDVESIYFNNENDFLVLYRSCAAEIDISRNDDNYCATDIPSIKPMRTSTLLDAADYFDFEMPDEIINEFPKRIYEQAFIKRAIKSNLIRDIFDDYNELLERFRIMKEEVKNLRKYSDKIRKELIARKASDNLIVTSRFGKIYAHNLCCSVRLLYDESENVSRLASKQANNLCLVRIEIQTNVEEATDALVAFLTKTRQQEIGEHVQRVKEAGACKFTPKPLS